MILPLSFKELNTLNPEVSLSFEELITLNPECFFVHTLIDVVKDNIEESLKRILSEPSLRPKGVYILHVSTRHL